MNTKSQFGIFEETFFDSFIILCMHCGKFMLVWQIFRHWEPYDIKDNIFSFSSNAKNVKFQKHCSYHMNIKKSMIPCTWSFVRCFNPSAFKNTEMYYINITRYHVMKQIRKCKLLNASLDHWYDFLKTKVGCVERWLEKQHKGL